MSLSIEVTLESSAIEFGPMIFPNEPPPNSLNLACMLVLKALGLQKQMMHSYENRVPKHKVTVAFKLRLTQGMPYSKILEVLAD